MKIVESYPECGEKMFKKAYNNRIIDLMIYFIEHFDIGEDIKHDVIVESIRNDDLEVAKVIRQYCKSFIIPEQRQLLDEIISKGYFEVFKYLIEEEHFNPNELDEKERTCSIENQLLSTFLFFS